MNEIYAKESAAMNMALNVSDRTVRENIDAQIASAIANVERLKMVREKLEKTGLLEIKISDLQQAMRY